MKRTRLGVGFRFAKADDAVAFFPLAAAFENGDAFEALENVAFSAKGAGAAETGMLSHKICKLFVLPPTSPARDGICTMELANGNRLINGGGI